MHCENVLLTELVTCMEQVFSHMGWVSLFISALLRDLKVMYSIQARKNLLHHIWKKQHFQMVQWHFIFAPFSPSQPATNLRPTSKTQMILSKWRPSKKPSTMGSIAPFTPQSLALLGTPGKQWRSFTLKGSGIATIVWTASMFTRWSKIRTSTWRSAPSQGRH